MKNVKRAYIKAISLSWKTYVIIPYLCIIMPVAIFHGLLVMIEGYLSLINEGFVWLGKYTSKPGKWWREQSPRIAKIDAIRLKEYQDELMARRRRNVFGNANKVE